MAHLNFVIPQHRNDLLENSDDCYYIKDIISKIEIKSKLSEAKQSFTDEGCEFIIQYFDTYYSILHHADSLQKDMLMRAYQDLHKAIQALNKTITFLLEDLDSLNDEMKLKFLNVMKMLVYIYTEMVNFIEMKNLLKLQNVESKNKKKMQSNDNVDVIDKLDVVVVLNNILQSEINFFWDPPTVEEAFINLIADVCYKLLENSAIKHEKTVRTEIFNTFGTLLKVYNHGVTFLVRLVQLVKTNEHLVSCVAEGIQLLITRYNFKNLVRDFVREITEWQTDEKYQDTQGTKYCALVLTEMANLMPQLMIPEVMYLNRYLAHDSYTLRNSVLNVITEVILAVLCKPNLTEEEEESRNEFFEILEEHLYDTTAQVRAKVVQHWARLQKENALPAKFQGKVLSKIVERLKDKGVIVRKNAASTITSFLQHNPFGARLERSYIEEQLKLNTDALLKLQKKLEELQPAECRKLEEEWQKRKDDIRKTIENNWDIDVLPADTAMLNDDLVAFVQEKIMEGKYKDAFECCCKGMPLCNNRELMKKDDLINFYTMALQITFYDVKSRTVELAAVGTQMAESDLQRFQTLHDLVTYFQDMSAFLYAIEAAIQLMADLLDSVSVTDTQESVNFFIASYKFDIKDARKGIVQMLNIMKRPEQDRKDQVLNAFKTIFLTTDAKNLREHTLTIVNRLIELLQFIPYDSIADFESIISSWTRTGVLDNAIIDELWRFFTKKEDVSAQQSLLATQLLTMAAMGRKAILKKNIKLVTTVAFSDRSANDLLFLGAACKLLSAGAYEKPNVEDKVPPFKIKPSDPMWENLVKILCDNFRRNTSFYNETITSAVEFIYKLCSKPDLIFEQFIGRLLPLLRENGSVDVYKLPNFVLMRLNHLLGEIAIKQLNFLDEDVYKELKRRNYIRNERKNNKNGKVKTKEKKKRVSSMSINQSALSTILNSSIAESVDETALEGAEADDTDAQFILNILEDSTVTGSGGLAMLAPFIVTVCENQALYNDSYLQGSSTIALLRYMTVSSKFCTKYIQLVFTILERTSFTDVKCTILVHLSDLLERYPNIIEPWTPRIYDRLKDQNLEVRKTAFYMLSNLLLRDLLLIKEQIFIMALFIVSEHEELKDMSTKFFTTLAAKENQLYNILPDIFSHLSEEKDLSQNNFNFIMKFLFNLISKSKQMENLVDRFCAKFTTSNESHKFEKIAYCLSLIEYNEKGLKKLLDNFPIYKEALHDDEVYAVFKQILNTCNKSAKNEIKAIVTEIEEKIKSFFEVNEEDKTPNAKKRNRLPMTAKKSVKKSKRKAVRKNIRTTSSSDSD